MSIISRITKSQLVKGSLILFLGNNFTSFGNFLYNLFMGRLLGPEKYGDLGAIVSLFVLIGTPLGILNLFVVKTISSYWGKGKHKSIANFFAYLTPRIFFLGILSTGMLLLGSPTINRFLNQESYLPILILALSFILNGPVTLNRAILQGTLSFSLLTINSLIEISIKVSISLILVVLNFGLVGALLGPFIGGIIGYILTVIELNMILGKTRETCENTISWEVLYSFLPIFLTSLTLTIFFTSDIILIRHYFTPVLAGEYVALSTVGKIIFYIVGPVISVMFPVISSRASKGDPYIVPLLGTLVLSLGLSAALMFVYFLFPKLIIDVLFGSRYIGVIPYMGLFSFFMIIYTINYILTHFLLSISHYKPIFFLFPISLLQSIMIVFFHHSITEVIWINIFTSLLYFFVVSFFVWQKESLVILKILSYISLKNIYGR